MRISDDKVKVNLRVLQQNLKRLRLERGITQRQLAEILDVSQPFISKLETGSIDNMELKTLVRIMTALGASLEIQIKNSR